MNYQEEALKQGFMATTHIKSDTAEVRAKALSKWLTDRGWRLSREDHTMEYVTDGPIQRALGMDSGDGF